jgi:hypothetical protein
MHFAALNQSGTHAATLLLKHGADKDAKDTVRRAARLRLSAQSTSHSLSCTRPRNLLLRRRYRAVAFAGPLPAAAC